MLKTIKQIQNNFSVPVEEVELEKNTDVLLSETEQYFEETFVAESSSSGSVTIPDQVLMAKIEKISNQNRQEFSTDPFTYYKQFSESDPLLYELAIVVFAAPCTQVSVERAFNALRILISPSRTNLKKKTLENILLVNLNREMLCRIDFDNM